jgi:hypothetical protein
MKNNNIKALSASVLICLCTFPMAKAQDALVYRYEAINKHKQIYPNSCIPSGIEMVLKLNKKVDSNFYNYQKIWGNKFDGTFANFDSLLLNGLRFYQKFNLSRNSEFPINDLFTTIDKELAESRYVLISLPSDSGWHMYVICNKLANGEFVAYSKAGSKNLMLSNVKEIVRQVKGTDIMIYREK